jgi:hypothetical protein
VESSDRLSSSDHWQSTRRWYLQLDNAPSHCAEKAVEILLEEEYLSVMESPASGPHRDRADPPAEATSLSERGRPPRGSGCGELTFQPKSSPPVQPLENLFNIIKGRIKLPSFLEENQTILSQRRKHLDLTVQSLYRVSRAEVNGVRRHFAKNVRAAAEWRPLEGEESILGKRLVQSAIQEHQHHGTGSEEAKD